MNIERKQSGRLNSRESFVLLKGPAPGARVPGSGPRAENSQWDRHDINDDDGEPSASGLLFLDDKIEC